jgi:hypothetical protein
MEELQEQLAEVLRQCIDNGLNLPFVVCSVGVNSSVLVIRVNDGRGPDTLAEHFENDSFAMPINIMVVDRDGGVARVVIDGGVINYH